MLWCASGYARAGYARAGVAVHYRIAEWCGSEVKGFEPLVLLKKHNGLASQRFKPLGHTSKIYHLLC